MKTIDLREYCKEWRKTNGFTMKQVADCGKMSLYTVSAFEHRRTCSLKVLLCYINAGMPLKEGFYEL